MILSVLASILLVIFLFLFHLGFLGISTLEFLQFITKRGYAEIDDVILNTMGVTIGFWVYRFLLKFLKFHATLN